MSSEITVLEYQTLSGRKPYSEWIRGLKDRRGVAIIRTRINRLRLMQFGNHRNIGDKVWELKISFGPGYRVYYLPDSISIVLLCGGDKGSQKRDIDKAKDFADDYWSRKQ